MSTINFRKILESLKSADLEEGKMNQLSLEIEEWVGDAFERWGHQVGGRERALMGFRKKFKGFEDEFVKRWNDAEMGDRPGDYLLNSVEEAFSNARPGENYPEEQKFSDDEMSMDYAKDEGMDWLKGKEGQMYLMSWIEAEDIDEKEGALEDLITSLQHVMIMGAYNTMNIDIEISTQESLDNIYEAGSPFSSKYDVPKRYWKLTYMLDGKKYSTQVTANSEDELKDNLVKHGYTHKWHGRKWNIPAEDIEIEQVHYTSGTYRGAGGYGESIDEGVDRKRVAAEGKKAASKGYDRRCPINYCHFDAVEKAWYKGFDSYEGNEVVDEKNNANSLMTSGAWNKAENPRFNKYNPPNTGNKNVSARKGFVGG